MTLDALEAQTYALIAAKGQDPAIFEGPTIRWWLSRGKTPEWIVREILLPERPRPTLVSTTPTPDGRR